ncbi:MAG: sensor histidine kinase [Lysobacterales bacterium]
MADPSPVGGLYRACACLLLGLASGMLLILALDRITHTELPQPLLRLHQAERSLAPFAAEPPDTHDWQAVTLPDDAPVDENSRLQHTWYRFRFDLPSPAPSLWGLMLQRPFAAPRIWVNGALLADSGVLRDPPPEYRHDLRYNLSPDLLRPGQNTIVVLVRSRINAAGMAELWLGDASAMAAYKAARNRIEKHWPQLAVQAIGFLALVLTGFFLVRPKDSAFGWFAAALACWAAHTALDLRGSSAGFPAWLARPTVLIALVWFVIFGLFFVLRLQRVCERKLERAVLWSGLVASMLALAASAIDLRSGYRMVSIYVIVPGVLAVGGVISARLWSAVRGQPLFSESSALLVLASLLLVIGVHDWLVDARVIGNWQSMRYLPFAAPMVFGVFGAMLLRRYASALAGAEMVNRQLESRVAEATVDIERNWRRIAEIDKERARFEERDRLMREMHDGVGGQLVQALALADRGESSALIREPVQTALDDLRLLIDASDVHSERLNDPLARLRERVSRRLAALGISLDWDFTEMPDLPRLSPQRSLQVLRVLQELITNVVKHARATTITVRCERIDDPLSGRPAQILIDLSDDGRGFDTEAVRGGRGLDNLRQRSAELGGAVNVFSRPGAGTRVRLQLPVLEDEG